MTYYRDPTGLETLILAIAIIVPLVYAFTHHGRARMLTLMLLVPWGLFVARVMYMHSSTRPGWDVQWAVLAFFGDLMTVLWPAFVLFVYWLIRLNPRSRRSEGTPGAAVVNAARPERVVSTSPPRRRDAAPAQQWPSLPRGAWCAQCGAPAAVGANYCAQCGHALASRSGSSDRPEMV